MLWTVHSGYQCNSDTNGPEHLSFCFCLSRNPLNVKLGTAESAFAGSNRWWDCFDLITKSLNVWSCWKFPLFLHTGDPDLHTSTPTHAQPEPVSETTALRNFLWSCNTAVVLPDRHKSSDWKWSAVRLSVSLLDFKYRPFFVRSPSNCHQSEDASLE